MEVIPSDSACAPILTWFRLAGVIRDATIHQITTLSPIEFLWQTVVLNLKKLYLVAVQLEVLQTAFKITSPHICIVWVRMPTYIHSITS